MKKFMQRARKLLMKNVATSLVVSFIVMLIIPTFLNWVAYNISQSTVKSTLESYNLSLLDKSVKSVDVDLYSIKQTMLNVTLDKIFSEFRYVTYPFTPDETYESVRIKENIQKYETANPIISEMYIYYSVSDKIFGSSIVYTPEGFFEILDENDRYSDFEDWITDIQSSNTNDFNNVHMTMMKENNSKMLTFACVSNARRNEQPLTTAILFVDINRVQNIIEAELGKQEKFLMVYDKNGNELLRVADDALEISPEAVKKSIAVENYGYITDKNEKYLICSHTSNTNKWKYVLLIPTKVSLGNFYHINKVLLLGTFLTILVGIALSVALAKKNSKPIEQLLKRLRLAFDRDTGEGDDWKYIIQSVDAIIENDKRLEDSLKRYVPMICESVLLGILKGQEKYCSITKDYLNSLGLHFPYSAFAVILFDIGENEATAENDLLEQRVTMEFILASELEKQFNEEYKAYAVGIETDIVGIIVNVDGQGDDLLKIINEIKENMYFQFNVFSTVAVGGTVEGISNISNSYNQAKEALAYKIIRGAGNVIIYEEINKNVNRLMPDFYEVENEKEISEAIRSGDADRVLELLETFIGRLKRSILPVEFIRCQIYSMMNIGFKILSEIGADDHEVFEDDSGLIQNSPNALTITEMYDRLKQMLLGICAYISRQRLENKPHTGNKMVEYIHEHYFMPDLGLVSIAEYFELSPSYLSYLFREQTGYRFNEYLNRVRVNAACQSLKTSNASISEIARSVGYSNDVSFNRAFKRIHNMSPGEYRRTQTKKG